MTFEVVCSIACAYHSKSLLLRTAIVIGVLLTLNFLSRIFSV